ncbi:MULTISPECIES: hypothetical protein [Acinetobacter]|jgi:hypothetical protein|uniref:hypothetical protein n=1 Tax=Acinetobacter TaxID=469 RepID=UPI00036CCA53|nr:MULTISPECIES: hypothetical protein [Acinetobacter]OTT97794.1 hypothetical protein CAT67_16805 [Acinetobacter baumannii]
MYHTQMIQTLLRHVWNPLPSFSNKNIVDIADQLYEIIENLGDINDISNFLMDISINEYNGNISSEKCRQVATQIINFYGGEPIKNDFGKMRFTVGQYYTFLSYISQKENLKMTFNMTLAGEIVLAPNELPLKGEERQQLIKVMQEAYADRLIIDDEKNSAYIRQNLSFR